MTEARLDTLGRAIHSSRRGPVPGTTGHGRTTAMLQVRVPPEVMTEIVERALAHPHEGRRRGTGKSAVVLEALRLYFAGGASAWERRYRNERALRLHLEQRIMRMKELLNE